MAVSPRSGSRPGTGSRGSAAAPASRAARRARLVPGQDSESRRRPIPGGHACSGPRAGRRPACPRAGPPDWAATAAVISCLWVPPAAWAAAGDGRRFGCRPQGRAPAGVAGRHADAQRLFPSARRLFRHADAQDHFLRLPSVPPARPLPARPPDAPGAGGSRGRCWQAAFAVTCSAVAAEQ